MMTIDDWHDWAVDRIMETIPDDGEDETKEHELLCDVIVAFEEDYYEDTIFS